MIRIIDHVFSSLAKLMPPFLCGENKSKLIGSTTRTALRISTKFDDVMISFRRKIDHGENRPHNFHIRLEQMPKAC